MIPPGAFDYRFAARRMRRRKLDEALLNAILQIVPEGKTIIDLGAGTGELVRALICQGRDAIGIDGTPKVKALSRGVVEEHDLTTIDPGWLSRDWGIFVEVGEHIPATHNKVLLTNVAESAVDGLIVSWAPPGQRGRNHVNCRTAEWVACEFGCRGWMVNEALTAIAREAAGPVWSQKLLIFERRYPCRSAT